MGSLIVSQTELIKRIFYRNGLGYIDIPRCGSTSIRNLLSQLDFKAEMFEERPDLFLFAVVRHPFDRLVSAIYGYANARLLLGGEADYDVPIDIARHVVSNLNENQFRPLSEHSIPQIEYIPWTPDIVYKIQNIELVRLLLAIYGFDPPSLPHLQEGNPQLKADIKEMLEPQADKIVEYYQEDYDLWKSAL